MDLKTNINISTNSSPSLLTAKSEAAFQGKETDLRGKEAALRGKEAALRGKDVSNSQEVALLGKGKTADSKASKEAAAEMQEVLRKALDVNPVQQRELQISFEKELNLVVVKVLDKESGDLVRQIPMPEKIAISKDLREVMEKMAENQSGIAVNQEV